MVVWGSRFFSIIPSNSLLTHLNFFSETRRDTTKPTGLEGCVFPRRKQSLCPKAHPEIEAVGLTKGSNALRQVKRPAEEYDA